MTVDRRQFLKRSALSAGAAAAGAGALGATGNARATAGQADPLERDGPMDVPAFATPAATLAAVPFHGGHQAGIVTPPPPAACFASFDVVTDQRGELVELFRALTATSRFLTAGGPAVNLGPDAPPSDSGTLGPDVPADGLTVTVGLGSSFFDPDRYGLQDSKPIHLDEMTAFPNDDLDPAQTGGDLLLQICGGSPDTAIHALREITKATRGAMQLNWRLDGFKSPSRPTGVPRNHFGFNDGIANPDVTDEQVANRLLWVTDGIGEPSWAVGGSYHAIRIIKQLIEFWDRVSLEEQQQMIGRDRDTGAPLGQQAVGDTPDFGSGTAIPATAHIRLANPRTAATEESRILRRGYNYDRGVDLNGNLDMGLIFNAFQQNLTRQFKANQTRLIGEPMVDYVTPVGGGYFFALPGVRDQSDWYARGLVENA